LAAAALQLAAFEWAYAQQATCANYPHSSCSISDAAFYPQVGAQSGVRFTDGDSACAAAASPPAYRNPRYWSNKPNLGTGCEYDLYTNGVTYAGRYFYQNWVLPSQNCPVLDVPQSTILNSYYNTHAYSGWYDVSDMTVSAAGRYWCVYCEAGTKYVGNGKCVPVSDIYRDNPYQCKKGYGHPIYPLTGTKHNDIALGNWFGMQVSASYDTRDKAPINNNELAFVVPGLPTFGPMWDISVQRRVVVQPGDVRNSVQVARGGRDWVSFIKNAAGDYKPTADVNATLVQLNSGWRYTEMDTGTEETYSIDGLLQTIVKGDGQVLSYFYSDAGTPSDIAPVAGLLIRIQDQSGRSVQFSYEQPQGAGLKPRIKRILDHAGQAIEASYSAAGFLTGFLWTDQRHVQFLYENSSLPWALTGVMDENENRTVTYAYDSAGRATSTEAAGGVERYAASWGNPPSWQVTESYDEQAGVIWREHRWVAPQNISVVQPSGQSVSLNSVDVLGMPRLQYQSQPAGSGCGASNSTMSYDSVGNLVARDDFRGQRTCYAYDASRNLETTKVEGLYAVGCSSYITLNATLPTNSRKTSTQWHPDWRLAVKVAEPGKITTRVYNGQPDPFAGGAVASCAPVDALLPDGKPIAVLCRQVEQATTDANGSQGFNATLQSGVAAREERWTYNRWGQVLTHDGPRTDVNDVTTYAYYSDTSFTGSGAEAVGHTLGDLQSVTNAAGQVTQYTKYNKHGQVLESIGPNGVVTTHTYDLRQRPLSVTEAGQTTTYTYDAAGQLTRVTWPDASYVGYEYDPAHRQTAVYDQLGNRIEYTLDNAGNRIAENVKDPSGVLSRQLSRSIDALGRVQQTTGRE
jgi:YD repeat-containing protein